MNGDDLIKKVEAVLSSSHIDRNDPHVIGLLQDCMTEIKQKDAEIASWIADRDSWIKRYEGLQASVCQETSYISRLEADYLSWVREYYRDMGEERAIAESLKALSKIRAGDKQ